MFHLLIIHGDFEFIRSEVKVTRVTLVINYVKQLTLNTLKTIKY